MHPIATLMALAEAQEKRQAVFTSSATARQQTALTQSGYRVHSFAVELSPKLMPLSDEVVYQDCFI